VSTGALIAPFAFLGDEKSLDEIENLYRNPGEDWMKQRGILFFLPDNISFAEVPGLEREMRKHITMDLVQRVAREQSRPHSQHHARFGGHSRRLPVPDDRR